MLAKISAAMSSLALLTACAVAPNSQWLFAEGPYPPQAERMRTFGRLVGDWSVTVEYAQPDGTWRQAEGEWRFGWILQGRAIEDVWTVYRPGARRNEPGAIMGYGATVRVYDAERDLWHVNWMGVLNHNYTQFTAREVGSEIVMDAADSDGQRFQWVFSDIGADSFRWRAQSTSDGGATWVVQQRMTASRRRSR